MFQFIQSLLFAASLTGVLASEAPAAAEGAIPHLAFAYAGVFLISFFLKKSDF
jgi:hypothetical protein